MKPNQLLGLFTLVGVLVVPGLAHARDIVAKADTISIRVGEDNHLIIDGKRYGKDYKWNTQPTDLPARWQAKPYRSHQACQSQRNSSQQTQSTYGDRVYRRSTIITKVCQ
jgi:hypothetical protein